MVTFVSQCEKKSLNKTRRVLDAFANRIGNRTWQTVITNEGLIAVKNLLRKTASKNTAVSCHWIRSRSRSEFLWVVGNKDKFNAEGVVPVNYTNQDNVLKMDEIMVDIKTYYANTKKQQLDQHLFAVGYVAHTIMNSLLDDDKLAKIVFMAGCFHDIGKADPAFQNWIIDKTKKKPLDELPDEGQHIDKAGKFSFEKHPRHNEISLFLYYLLKEKGSINQQNIDSLKHAIYWHHAKPFRKKAFEKLYTVYDKLKVNLTEEQLKSLYSAFNQIIASVNNIANEYDLENEVSLPQLPASITSLDDDQEYELEKEDLPKYKIYSASDNIKNYTKNIKQNAKNNLIRTALITADRLVSRMNSEALTRNIEESSLDSIFQIDNTKGRELKRHIQNCLDGFIKNYPSSERNTAQNKVAIQLTEVEHVGVLQGAAGCGKTKIALEWAALGNAKKIIWVCPRVQVCQGLIKDLVENEEYLPDAKIEINTGEFKTIYQSGNEEETPEGQEFSGDIVITTIDQITNSIITHRNVTTLVEYMNAHVVFDEYHEYITMPAFNLLFSELVECKKLQNSKANTLLVSATPNYHFVKNILGIDVEDIIRMDSFNESTFNIEFLNFDEKAFDSSNPLYQEQPKNTFVISNTAITAQKSFIQNLAHAPTCFPVSAIV
jgi:CRISPR-associated endonuclease/helicase Cas3